MVDAVSTARNDAVVLWKGCLAGTDRGHQALALGFSLLHTAKQCAGRPWGGKGQSKKEKKGGVPPDDMCRGTQLAPGRSGAGTLWLPSCCLFPKQH